MTSLSVFNTSVRTDEHGRYCLNDLHKAAIAKGEATASQRPANYLKSAPVKAFIDAISENATTVAVSKTEGRNGGTYATELVAIRYAGWISPAFEVEVYRTFQGVARGEEATVARAIGNQTDTEAAQRNSVRAQSKAVRLHFTDSLKYHGVTGQGYGACTNALYIPLFGGKAPQLREDRGLAKMPTCAKA